MLHLQWLLTERNQMRQAWYRCREWLDGSKTAAAINEFYSVTRSPTPRAGPTRCRRRGSKGRHVSRPAVDREPSWQERDVLGWFDEHTPEFFEPLEIWHVAVLRDEFRLHAGRRPRPDRSYVPPWSVRAQRFGRRVLNAARRRLPI